MQLAFSGRLGKASSPNLVLAILCIGIFLAALDQTVVYGALPAMMTDLALPVTKLDQAAWVVIGYLLGYTVAMPLMGRVSDVYGHRRIYVLSLLIFTAGSLLVGLSTSLQLVVGARVIQAIGGGALVPVAMAIAGDIFAQKGRAVALGIIGAAVEAGGAIGPFYGAALSQFWGWRWVFWINLPISLMAIWVVLRFLPPSPRSRGRVDYFGGFLLAAGLALFCLGISREPAQSYFLVYIIGFLVVALSLIVLFAVRADRIPEPLVRPAWFRNAAFSAANVTNLLVGGALIIAMVNIPLMSDTIMGRSPLEGGLRLLRLTIALSAGAVIGGLLCRRVGHRLPTALGLILGSAGFFFMSQWPLGLADPRMTLDLATCGIGLGLVIAPLATAVIDSAAADQRGIASSLIVMMRMVGMMIGLSAITSWGMGRFHLMTASMSLTYIVTAPERLTGALLSLFHDFFLAAMAICLIALIPALWPARPSPAAPRAAPRLK